MTARIALPTSLDMARATPGTLRAGGTDLTDRRHRGVHDGDLVDLRDVDGLDHVTPLEGGGLEIGAGVSIARIAAEPVVHDGWHALAEAAGGLATPQIRARATLGGGLLQEVRCWYFRSAEFTCLKKGGATCFARGGDAEFHSVVDKGPCIAPHPSTLAVALLAYGATAVVNGEVRGIAELLGDGTNPRQTHALGEGEILEAVRLPPPIPGDRGAYLRAIHRSRSEWPLVECALRITVDRGKIMSLAIALGGIANRPIRYDDAAAACVGLATDDPRLDGILKSLVNTERALPQAAYKALLVPTLVRDTLERALAAPAAPVPTPAPAAPGGTP